MRAMIYIRKQERMRNMRTKFISFLFRFQYETVLRAWWNNVFFMKRHAHGIPVYKVHYRI